MDTLVRGSLAMTLCGGFLTLQSNPFLQTLRQESNHQWAREALSPKQHDKIPRGKYPSSLSPLSLFLIWKAGVVAGRVVALLQH